MMKAALQLNVGQQLALTPQLQQAIRLLQLSSVELKQEIQEILNSNLMLESNDNITESTQLDETQTIEPHHATDTDTPSQTDEISVEANFEEFGLDFSHYQENTEASNTDNFLKETSTLRDYLYWQMRLTPFSDTDQLIAIAIIDAIGEDGFLSCSLEDIYAGLKNTFPDLELDEVEAVLQLIQHFDPVGVAARDAKECLLIQLNQLPQETPWLCEAKKMVQNHLAYLGQKNYRYLQREYRLNAEDLKQVTALIQQLKPYPGSTIVDFEPDYIVPDIVVRKVENRWIVELNQDIMPQVRINQQYANLIQRANHSPSNHLLKTHLQEARWFIKSLQSRNETLLKVAKCIVAHQRDFLELGDEGMKPLVLHRVAEIIGMHESTVSRITTKKYMYTPRGIFELKYFFSSHLDTEKGGECSATAIRALIKKLIGTENPHRPFSDSKIASLLKQQGVRVARRTIAKYREAMMIPPSHERKML